jgi:DNA-binding IscR family transcriptional regulator
MVITNKMKFNKRYNQPVGKSNSLNDIAKLSGISKSILQQVYNRGVGAWKTNPGSVRNVRGVKGGPGKKMSKEQWAIARVYSFVVGGTTRRTADKDLWAKHKGK